VRWAGVLLCFVAAYRLLGTPLQITAVVVALSSACCSLASWLAPGVATGRVVTGLQHVLVALGGFFFFVSIAMR
jgi:hypothetical protein